MNDLLMQKELIYRLKLYQKKFITNTVFILLIVKLVIFSNILFWGLDYSLVLKISLLLIISDVIGVAVIYYSFQKKIQKISKDFTTSLE